MSVLNFETKQTYAQEQAQKIYTHVVGMRIAEHVVMTSNAKDQKMHREFPKIANELRKKDLKVSFTDNWGTTKWVIYI